MFAKTNAKGGKPLIKTHDKRFLIKEVKKEEKDFFMQILPKYHQHLKKNPKSLLAKIVGVYSIKIENKDKVYQVLMESIDPIDDQFIKFKYDLKFSSVNRREFKSKEEVIAVQRKLLEQSELYRELLVCADSFPLYSPSMTSRIGSSSSHFKRGGKFSMSSDSRYVRGQTSSEAKPSRNREDDDMDSEQLVRSVDQQPLIELKATPALMDKLKFMKDSDFKLMHNRALPVLEE